MPNLFTKAFPIHMAKGLNSMRAKAFNCDCLVEIRDARIPMSSSNPEFDYLMRHHHNRLLLISKIDMADKRRTKNIMKTYSGDPNTQVLYTVNRPGTRKGTESIRRVMRVMKDMAMECQTDDELSTFRTLIYGIPNVGKSSFINLARQNFTKRGGRATPVGKAPGITRSVLRNIIISEKPQIVSLDTPGIVPPRLTDPLIGMKLALVGTFPDHKIGEDLIADFLLYTLNKQNNTMYLGMCGLESPCDDLDAVLKAHSTKHGLIERGGPNFYLSSKMLIADFRAGNYGRMTLD